MTLDEFFTGYELSRPIFDALHHIIAQTGHAQLRVSKSQVAFRHSKPFAWAWIPGRYLSGKPAPLVLTLAFRGRNPSPRWKEIVEPTPGRFMHHLELYNCDDLDTEVRQWITEAWELAG